MGDRTGFFEIPSGKTRVFLADFLEENAGSTSRHQCLDHRDGFGAVPMASPRRRAISSPSGFRITVIGRPNTPISRAICWLMSRYCGRSVTPVSSKNRRIACGWLKPVASVTTVKSSPAERVVQVLQRRHLFAAGRAPRGPEVQDDVAARVVGQRTFGPVHAQEGQVGGACGSSWTTSPRISPVRSSEMHPAHLHRQTARGRGRTPQHAEHLIFPPKGETT
jgi:hypothetical protein